MKTVILVQARINSKRLPRKILLDIGGKTALERVVDRCKEVPGADEVIVCCPVADEMKIYERTGIPPYPGPEHDLLERLLGAARMCKATKIVRVTADCPLIDPQVIQRCLNHAFVVDRPVVCNWMRRLYPNGQDCEVYDVPYLEKFAEGELSITDREWFPLKLLKDDPDHWHSVECSYDASQYRMTLDYLEDLGALRLIQGAMGDKMWGWEAIVSWLQKNPRVFQMNHKYAKETGGEIK